MKDNKIKYFKTLTLVGLFISYVSVADTDTNINELFKEYNKNVVLNSKVNDMKLENKILEQNTFKKKLSILSGKTTAVENISAEFNYYKSSIYEIFTKPSYITTIKLNKDENLIYVGGGDVENWQIDETNGGNDNSTYLMIKPLFEDLKTNLSIITDKRTYFLTLESTNKSYNPYVQWKYPYDDNMYHIKKLKAKKQQKEIELSVTNTKELVFGYEYDRKNILAPQQVFNDGLKTIIILNPKLQEAPVVYVYGDDNVLSLVNYRMIDNKIIIDKVVNKIQLVLGVELLEIKK